MYNNNKFPISYLWFLLYESVYSHGEKFSLSKCPNLNIFFNFHVKKTTFKIIILYLFIFT